MKIDINHIAKLARLKMDEQQAEKFARQMEGIIDMVANLPEIDGVADGLDPANPMKLREDVAIPSAAKRNDILANAPQVEAGCVVVPRIVE
ncbi:MAG: Asp-tRNA(Asn)/Glu-tRNA(Gln) amidotransferase subunit GatC [Oscillospiraceae bacterium]|nr:Asp-tRNA(Asn)/Glu-tRNA(Gln) amidotransferase subunit GatC [Oscillospiraceae bacterium]